MTTRGTEFIWWKQRGIDNDWTMPPKPHWIIRLPIIRHLWVMRESFCVERHYSHGIGSIGLRSGYDDWALHGMWNDWWPNSGEPR